MPRGHKSRRHARQKGAQAKDDMQGVEVAQEAETSAAAALAVKAEATPAATAAAKTSPPAAAAAALPAAKAGAKASAPPTGKATSPAAATGAATTIAARAAVKAAARSAPPAAAAEESEAGKESSFTKGVSGAAPCSPPLTSLRGSPSEGALPADGSVVSPDLGSSCKYDECLSEASHCTEYMSEEPQCPIETLGSLILKKFDLKQPFTRSEMLLSIDKKYRDDFPQIFKTVQKQLEAIFAMEVREVESTRHSYSLFSMLSLPNNGRVRPGRGYPKSGLLMKILSVILMKGHRASEEDIWKFLNRLHVYPGKKHIFFGNANRLLTQDFVKLKYLEYRQVPGCLLPRREFLWGPQAHAEISKEKIMQYLVGMNKICPPYFSYLYEDFGREEIEQFQASLSAKRVSTGKPRAVARAMYPAFAKPIDI
nr:melanoma-associated antigen B5-like [Cavia porcellus]